MNDFCPTDVHLSGAETVKVQSHHKKISAELTLDFSTTKFPQSQTLIPTNNYSKAVIFRTAKQD